VLAHAGKQGRRVVAAFIGTAFAQDDADAARNQWRQIADQLRRWRNLTGLEPDSEMWPGDEAALADALERLLNDPALAARLGRSARRLLRRFGTR